MKLAARHIPSLFVAARLLLLAPLWAFALAGMGQALAAGLLIALLTDVLDGFAARRLGVDDLALSRFDSLADKLLTLSVLAWILLLHPAILVENGVLALLALLLALSSWLVGLLRHGRVTGLHLPIAKLGGAIQAIFVLHSFWVGTYSRPLFLLAVTLWCLAAAAEIAVQLRDPAVGARRAP